MVWRLSLDEEFNDDADVIRPVAAHDAADWSDDYLDEAEDTDAYTERGISEDLDNDAMTPAEAAFMRGIVSGWVG